MIDDNSADEEDSLPQQIVSFSDRINQTRQTIHNRLVKRVGKLSNRQSRIAVLVAAGAVLLAQPVAAAPLDKVGQALCQNGLGQLLAILFAAFSFYFFVKGGLRTMKGLDKKGSAKSGTQQEGDEELVGAGYSFAAAAAPIVLTAILEIIGINTISCFDFSVGVFAMMSPTTPFAAVVSSAVPQVAPVVDLLGPAGTQGLSVAALGVFGYVRA